MKIELTKVGKCLNMRPEYLDTYCRARLAFHKDKKAGANVSIDDYLKRAFGIYGMSASDIAKISNDCTVVLTHLMQRRNQYELVIDNTHLAYMTSVNGQDYPILY